MADYTQGSKKEVAEVKFLIHDLRVERFINEVIHFHVTLNTDLEIYGVEQAADPARRGSAGAEDEGHRPSQGLPGLLQRRQELLAGSDHPAGRQELRRDHPQHLRLDLEPPLGALRQGPGLSAGGIPLGPLARSCIETASTGSPASPAASSTSWTKKRNREVHTEFDVGAELEDFTRNVARPYVTEKGGTSVEIRLDRLDSAIIGGSQPRFRRMYFNLVMNAADAMTDRSGGVIDVSDTVEGDRVVLRVRDNGSGMTQEKIRQLLTDRETLDGELHSLGFVFVRQTVAELNGELSIDSAPGEGTTVTVRLPVLSR